MTTFARKLIRNLVNLNTLWTEISVMSVSAANMFRNLCVWIQSYAAMHITSFTTVSCWYHVVFCIYCRTITM